MWPFSVFLFDFQILAELVLKPQFSFIQGSLPLFHLDRILWMFYNFLMWSSRKKKRARRLLSGRKSLNTTLAEFVSEFWNWKVLSYLFFSFTYMRLQLRVMTLSWRHFQHSYITVTVNLLRLYPSQQFPLFRTLKLY